MRRDGRRTVLEDQVPRGNEPLPSGRACATAAAGAAWSSSRTRTTARSISPTSAAGCSTARAAAAATTPTARARGRLRAAHGGQPSELNWLPADLRLPPGRRRPRALLVAPAGLGRSRERACGRRLGTRRAFSATRTRCPSETLSDHIVAWPGKWPKGAKIAGETGADRASARVIPEPRIFLWNQLWPPRLLGAGRRPPCPPSPTPPLFQPRSDIPPEVWPGRLIFARSVSPGYGRCRNHTGGRDGARQLPNTATRQLVTRIRRGAHRPTMPRAMRAPDYGSHAADRDRRRRRAQASPGTM